MRYDTPIYFRHIEPGKYNANTGNYGEDTITEVKVDASVTDTTTQMLNMVYGTFKQGSKTVRLLRPYTKAFKNIRIGELVYKVDFYRNNKVFVVSEVKG